MSSSERPHKGSPYAQELITHLQPYCTPRKTERGEQLDFKVNGQGVLPDPRGNRSGLSPKR